MTVEIKPHCVIYYGATERFGMASLSDEYLANIAALLFINVANIKR